MSVDARDTAGFITHTHKKCISTQNRTQGDNGLGHCGTDYTTCNAMQAIRT